MTDCGCSSEFQRTLAESAHPEHLEAAKKLAADEWKLASDDAVTIDDDYKHALAGKFEGYIKPSLWDRFKAALHAEFDLLNRAG